jgi:transcriptional regulator with XRE-family HTH domain
MMTDQLVLTLDDVATRGDHEATPRMDGDTQAFTQAVGRAVRQVRQAKGWLVADLAREAGLSQSQISRLELGHRPMSMAGLFRLCRALGIQPRHVIAWAQQEAFPAGHDAWPGTGQTWTAFDAAIPVVRPVEGADDINPHLVHRKESTDGHH